MILILKSSEKKKEFKKAVYIILKKMVQFKLNHLETNLNVVKVNYDT